MDRNTSDVMLEQKRKVRKYFDADTGWQGELYQSPNDWFARTVVRRRRQVLESIRALPLPRGSAALDIGCGSGVYLEALASMGFHCTGIDSSEEMVRTSRKRLARKGLTAEGVFLGDIEALPFRDSAFDLVLSIGVLGYLLDEGRAAREVWRILRPGGYWIVNVANVVSLSNADFYLRRWIQSLYRAKNNRTTSAVETSFRSPWVEKNSPVGHQYRLFHPKRLEKRMKGLGFTVLSSHTVGFQFRLLRKSRLLPEGILEGLERLLESYVLSSRVPFFRYLGDYCTLVMQAR